MTLIAVNVTRSLLHRFLQVRFEPVVTFHIVERVTNDNFTLAIHRDAIIGIGQVLRRKPEVQRMLRHQIKSPSRRNLWRARAQSVSVELADKRNVAHRVLPILRSQVEVIHGQRLLKDGWVWTLRKSHHYRIDVAHVVSSNYI